MDTSTCLPSPERCVVELLVLARHSHHHQLPESSTQDGSAVTQTWPDMWTSSESPDDAALKKTYGALSLLVSEPA